ncbi:hypothetical protein I5M27_18420 [Adhaeribacter sp. BT258]|uniref:DUF7660 domain-containing protein n=1 Tax=Adhaeribacter terrigena TaxID=2793070 RepID=A0ABS1C6G1_9BACT|nr:hypothetical protein [Adhaeribacter terrigena]MBK0404966.1 hypothetical protein [Adhaeribacter terrigena]
MKDFLEIEVKDRQTFSEFAKLLLEDFEKNKENWENKNLGDFLEALQRYSEDVDGYYKNVHPELDANVPTWRVFADILCGATMYE